MGRDPRSTASAGWRLNFTDGTGMGFRHSSDSLPGFQREVNSTQNLYLGKLATVTDAERYGIGLAVSGREEYMLFILGDSEAALQTVLNLSQPFSPRSGLAAQLKEALR